MTRRFFRPFASLLLNIIFAFMWFILSIFLSMSLLPFPKSEDELVVFIALHFAIFMIPLVLVECLYEAYQEHRNNLFLNKDIFTQGLHHIRRMAAYRRSLRAELAERLHNKLSRSSDSRATDIDYLVSRATKSTEVFLSSLEKSEPLAEAMDKTYTELYS